MIKHKFTTLTIFFLGLILVEIPCRLLASSVDFGWGRPFEVALISKKGDGGRYLILPIQITNSDDKRFGSDLDIVAVTNTGKQYVPIPPTKITDGEILGISELKGSIFPGVTRRAIALFKNIDPTANVIHFYIGGLEGTMEKERKGVRYLRISYKRNLEGWNWDGTSILE